MYTVVAMLIERLPICVHVTPSDEREAVKVLPERTSFTHTGAVPEPPLISVELPPVLARYCMRTPLLGDTTAIACLELAFKDSRIITPALAHALVLVCVSTLATIVPLPVSGWYTKRN
jgi:hypothetical protein